MSSSMTSNSCASGAARVTPNTSQDDIVDKPKSSKDTGWDNGSL